MSVFVKCLNKVSFGMFLLTLRFLIVCCKLDKTQ